MDLSGASVWSPADSSWLTLVYAIFVLLRCCSTISSRRCSMILLEDMIRIWITYPAEYFRDISIILKNLNPSFPSQACEFIEACTCSRYKQAA
ncbi:hypothetical protein F4777DRAFT_44403 [Nemania sp. FL0916]|nr:hypothetical protein F4777DRAFT_44403 [Nemania sp. FL0916]